MRNKELKVTEEFTNLFDYELVIYKNILIKGRIKITFYNYIIVTRKGIFAIKTKTILGRMVTDKYKVKWKSYIGFIPFIFTNPPLDVSHKSCDLDFVSDCDMDKIIPISIIKNKGKRHFYIDMDYTQKEKFYYELHHHEDIFSDKGVAKICELIEKKAQPTEDIKSFQRDLYGIANNINQIAKIANSRYSVSHDDYKYISNYLSDFILRFERKIYSRQK